MWILYLYFAIIAVICLVPTIVSFFVKNKTIKGILSGLGAIGFFVMSSVAVLFFAERYFKSNGIWLYYVVGAMIYTILMLLSWRAFRKKTRVIVCSSILAAAIIMNVSVSVYTNYQKSLIMEQQEEIDLIPYSAFGNYEYKNGELVHVVSIAAKLNEPSTLKLIDNLPRLDGATALFPLYSAFVEAVYPEPEPIEGFNPYSPYSADFSDRYMDKEETQKLPDAIAACTKTSGAFQNLANGKADIVFLMDVSADMEKLAQEKGLEIVLTPIGREAFIFFVNKFNSIDNLSSTDIKRIYSGEVTNWKQVGGKNNEIRVYQRPANSGSQTALEKLMGGTPIIETKEEDVFDFMFGMVKQVASYRNYKNSLGYSFMYYVKDMVGDNNTKFLSIDGVAPTSENIANGSYVFADDFYTVTVKRDGEYLNPERAENIDALLEWMTSSQGQYLVEATGYTPLGVRQ